MAPADSGSANFPCSRLQFLLSSCVCLWYLYVSVTGSGSWMNLGRTATFLAGLGSFQVSYSYGTDFHGFSMFFFFFCIWMHQFLRQWHWQVHQGSISLKKRTNLDKHDMLEEPRTKDDQGLETTCQQPPRSKQDCENLWDFNIFSNFCEIKLSCWAVSRHGASWSCHRSFCRPKMESQSDSSLPGHRWHAFYVLLFSKWCGANHNSSLIENTCKLGGQVVDLERSTFNPSLELRIHQACDKLRKCPQVACRPGCHKSSWLDLPVEKSHLIQRNWRNSPKLRIIMSASPGTLYTGMGHLLTQK